MFVDATATVGFFGGGGLMNGNKRPPLFGNLAFAHVDVRSCDCELQLMLVDVDF